MDALVDLNVLFLRVFLIRRPMLDAVLVEFRYRITDYRIPNTGLPCF